MSDATTPRVLIGCERSGVVRRAFARMGFVAFSCDLFPADDGDMRNHIVGDVREILTAEWSLIIMHPDCTYLTSSGLHWNKRVPGRAQKTEDALEFVREILDAPCPRIALENPIGCIGTRIRKADQIIQPWMFGDDASKATCLWLKNLPLLTPTNIVRGRIVDGKERWANQTDSGQNKLGPSPDRARLRSQTYPGFADAMAKQWGALL